MKVVKKIKEKWAIKKYDFKPSIVDGPIGNVENAVFYCVDGIGDAMVCSPIIRAIMAKCTGVAFFICSSSSQLYIKLLENKYPNIILLPIGNKKDITENALVHISTIIKEHGKVDVLINGLGRISPTFAQLASLLRPQAVLSAMESAKRSSRPKMVHRSVHYSNLLYRRGISIVDCWGVIAQMIGGYYDRRLLFPISDRFTVCDSYIAISLSGSSWGTISEENALIMCRTISRYFSGNICLIASPGIEELCQSIASKLKNVLVSPLPATLEQSGICIKNARALVSVCSAPVHIAGAFNTPVIVIRGKRQREWSAVVSHSVEYITPQYDINSFDEKEFNLIFSKFINDILA